MVLVTGLEPVRYCYRGILSPLRLPISPHQQIYLQLNKSLYIILFLPFCRQPLHQHTVLTAFILYISEFKMSIFIFELNEIRQI